MVLTMKAGGALCMLLLCVGCEETSTGAESASSSNATPSSPVAWSRDAPSAAPSRDHLPVEPPPGLRPASCTDLTLPKGSTHKTVPRDPGKFRLLSAGTPPHRELRYQWVWGQETAVGVRNSYAKRGEKPPPFDGPPEARGKAIVQCISKSGDARIRVRVGTDHRRYAKQLVGYQVVSARGRSIKAGIIGLGMKLPKHLDGAQGEYDAFSPVRLPEQAVGVGAKWEAVHELPNGVRETSVYEITALEGHTVEIAAAISQEEIPNKPGIKVLMSGRGTLHVDLTRPLARSEIFLESDKMGTVGAQVMLDEEPDK